jgi:dihydrofolate reductase
LSGDVPHHVPNGDSSFTFVTNGIESAITQAKAGAGDKNVYVIGGGNRASTGGVF